MDELNQTWSAASSKMYSQSTPPPTADGEAPPNTDSADSTDTPPTNDSVEEAEYTVVEDDDNK
jgi:hypothetical protein